MRELPNYIDLVERARQGHPEALEDLTEQARVRLEAYVGRITLSDDLTQDIVQETLVTMLEELNNLKHAAGFWNWLYKIALNHTRAVYRSHWNRKSVPLADVSDTLPAQEDHGFARVMREEIEQSVLQAMQRLAPKHRAILSMRCYDQLPYTLISEQLDCSEFAARALFVRAKRALAKNLSKLGLGKGSLLLSLTLFGRITSTTEAATQCSVNTALLEAGLFPTLTLSIFTLPFMSISIALFTTILGIHYWATSNERIIDSQVYQTARLSSGIPNLSTGYTQWRYYSQNEPFKNTCIHVRQRNESGQELMQVLQNHLGTHIKLGNTVYLNNAHLWMQDLSVLRLPSDDPSLHQQLDRIEGRMTPSPPPHIASTDAIEVTRQTGHSPAYKVLEPALAEEECLQYGWPEHIHVQDQRDAIHQQGWAGVTIKGQINNIPIKAIGCIPLQSAFVTKKPPRFQWIVGDLGCLFDTAQNTGSKHTSSKTEQSLPRGFFLQGLSRPWEGLHTIDTIRRDVALYKLPFHTTLEDSQRLAIITIEQGDYQLRYEIDMQTDLVSNIQFSNKQKSQSLGQLDFKYSTVSPNDRDLKRDNNMVEQSHMKLHTQNLWLLQLLEILD